MPDDEGDLAGVDGVSTHLVDELVRRPGGQARPLPLVVALGARGTGKTALLRRIRDRCANRVPWAMLDLEELGEARPSGILTGIAFELSRDVPQFGRIAFPRLWLCALVLTGNLNHTDRGQALAEVNAVMREDRPVEQHRQQVLGLAQLAADAAGLPGWAPSATDALLNGLDWLSRRRVLRAIKGMSRSAPRDPRDLLVDLHHKDKGASDDRAAVDAIVFDAFLADLHQAFTGRLHQLRRTANCVVLLDNAHTPAGKAFLSGLLAARRRSRAGGDHAAVFVTSRTWNVDWNGTWRRPGTLPTGHAPLPPTPEEVKRDLHTEWRHWFLVRLGHLNPTDTEDMVKRAATSRLPASLPYRLTHGHPGGLRTMLDVLARQEEHVPLRRLLSVPAHPDRTASFADEALGRLLGDLPASQVDDLVTASAGRGVEFLSDAAILGTDLPDGGGALYTFLLNNFLLTVADDGDARRVVLDPWLRTLLLHRLAQREDAERGWDAVHRRCRDHYEDQGQATEAQYHDLALGNVRSAVAHLARPFTSDRQLDMATALKWLAELDVITSAPNRLPRDAEPLTQVEQLIEGVPPTGSHGAALARLVAALWIAADPLGDPDDTLRGRIMEAYRRLGQHGGEGSILLHDRAER
jgi:hypothetical protein